MTRLTIATLSLSIAAAAVTTRPRAAPKAGAAALPEEALAAMAQVRAAAGKRDWEALRGLMVEELNYDDNETYSAAAALEAWKKDARPVALSPPAGPGTSASGPPPGQAGWAAAAPPVAPAPPPRPRAPGRAAA